VGFADLLRFAVGALFGHRLRTALSVLGVSVGIAAVIALTALGEGARRYVTGEFAGLGSNLVIMMPGRVETTGVTPFGGVVHDLTLEDLRAITRVAGVQQAAPLAVGTEEVRAGERARSVPVLGTTAEFVEVRRIRVAAGRFLAPGDPDAGGNEMVLGIKAARELFGADSPLGQVVRVGSWRFRVVGVLEPRGRGLGFAFDFDDLVFIPVRTAMRMFNRPSLFRIVIDVPAASEMEEVKGRLLALMRERHRAEDVTVITQDALVSAFSSIMQALTLALAAIASVSLVVAGVGIMNVMLVSVAERRAEIGLLKALGARDRQVLAAFLTEAVVLSVVGGLIGLATGFAAIVAFRRFYPSFPAMPPGWAIAAALAMSVLVGMAFGVWPARRATRLDPVLALARQ
jgi:putative ABC transport system permease protein